MKKTTEKKVLLSERCDNYLATYKQKYLAPWEKSIRCLLALDETKITTKEKREIYASVEKELRCSMPDMVKIYNDAEIYLKILDAKIKQNAVLESYVEAFVAVQAQCLYYGYQMHKILITIYRWGYEEADKKTTSQQRLQILVSEWEALKQYYEKNKQAILNINGKEERQFAEMEDDLAISIKLSKDEVLSPLEKILRKAEVGRNQHASDKLFIQAMSIAETDEMRYRILKKRSRYYMLRENKQIGNGFYNTMTAVDNAGVDYVSYLAERAKEKMALLTKINGTGEYDLDELDLAQEIFSFCKVANILIQVAIAKKNQEERYCLIHHLKDCKNIAKTILQKFPQLSFDVSLLEECYAKRKEEWQHEKELMAQKEVDDKLNEEGQQVLQKAYDDAFASILAELGCNEKINTKGMKKKKTTSSNENLKREEIDSDKDEEAEGVLTIEIPAENNIKMPMNEAEILLNQAEEYKKNAENILNRKGAVHEAISEFESAKSALQKALTLFNEQYAEDAVLKEAILLVLSHTEKLLIEAINKQKMYVEKLNAVRLAAKQHIIQAHGMEAWYKNVKKPVHQLSKHTQERITAINDLNRLQMVQKAMGNLKVAEEWQPLVTEKSFNESAPEVIHTKKTRSEVREYFRFFRSHCPPDHEARKLTRSCSVDSFLSPEQITGKEMLKKIYGW